MAGRFDNTDHINNETITNDNDNDNEKERNAMQLTHGDELCNYNQLIRLAYEKNTCVNFRNLFLCFLAV